MRVDVMSTLCTYKYMVHVVGEQLYIHTDIHF